MEASTSLKMKNQDIANLPQDILINIFTRLRVKHLCQLKCLSKEWLQAISSTQFKNLHRDQSKKNPSLSLISGSNGNSFRSQILHLSFVDPIQESVIDEIENIAEIGRGCFGYISGGDLLCFYNVGVGQLWVCNPVMKKTVSLPNLSKPFSGKAGLGFVPSTNEYKIVVSFERKVEYDEDYESYRGGEDCLRFEIITLKQDEKRLSIGRWRDLQLQSCHQSFETHFQPVQINGFMYWLISCGSSREVKILEMNLENEQLKTFDCPKNGVDFRHSHLAEIKGHLCLVYNDGGFGFMLDIWMLMMMEHEKRQDWCHVYNKIEVLERAYDVTVLGCVSRNEDDDSSCGDLLIRSRNWNYFFCYETQAKELRQLQSLSEMKYDRCALYFDSFFSIGMSSN